MYVLQESVLFQKPNSPSAVQVVQGDEIPDECWSATPESIRAELIEQGRVGESLPLPELDLEPVEPEGAPGRVASASSASESEDEGDSEPEREFDETANKQRLNEEDPALTKLLSEEDGDGVGSDQLPGSLPEDSQDSESEASDEEVEGDDEELQRLLAEEQGESS